MRKLSSNYSVTYEVRDENNKIINKKHNYNCYSLLYNKGIKNTDKLILSDFITIETEKYSKIYIKRLAKICDLRLRFIDENTVELIGFKDIFYIKLFTTLFRILFEVYGGYGSKGSVAIKTVDFLNSYIKQKNNSGYKDMLERLIYYYQKSKIYQGSGHGITSSQDQLILVKNIKKLRSWDSKKHWDDMQSFFSKEN